MILPLRRYATFAGRSRRREYWLFALFAAVLLVAAAAIDVALGYGRVGSDQGLGTYRAYASTWGPVEMVVGLGLLLPQLAVQVRRLHDIDRSGWWLLLWLLPVLGGFVLFVFMLLDGTHGQNRFGADPKELASYAG
jgi:uncharacterized membrane protein YhaH (DUF805 family)